MDGGHRFARWMLHRRRDRRSIDRQIRAHIDNPDDASVVPPRPRMSTPVIRDPGYFGEFNNAGRLQEESNTFWYVSVPVLDYMLRYLALAPIDCCFQWYSSFAQPHARLQFDKPARYMSVVCRAVDDVLPSRGDEWMARSAEHSWEHRGLTDWQKAKSQPLSSAVYRRPPHREAWRDDTGTLYLWKATETMREAPIPAGPGESHNLRLDDLA